MCGIFGLIGTNGTQDFRNLTFSGLALLNRSRGEHSWGFTTISNQQATTSRYMGPPADVYNTLHKATNLTNPQMLLGHTRQASCGAITIENAHPLTEGRITGAHNGVITNHIQLALRYNTDPQLDSRVIFAALDQDGPEGLLKLRGYASIWWYDPETPDKCYLWRSNNILHIGSDRYGNIAFSSEARHLAMCNIKNVTQITEGRIISIDSRNLKVTQSNKRYLIKFFERTYELLTEWREQ